MAKPNRLFVVGLIIVLVLGACGEGDAKDSDDATQPAGLTATAVEESASQEPSPSATSADAAPPQPTSTLPPEPLSAQPTEAPDDADATEQPVDQTSSGSGNTTGLGTLFNLGSIETDPQVLESSSFQSYRLHARWTVQPKDGTSGPATTMEVDVAHVRDPLAEEMTFFDEQQGIQSKMIHIGDKLWIESGGQWIEVSGTDISSFDEMLFALDSAAPGLTGDAQLVGQEDVNGVSTQHYTFDNSILGPDLAGFSTVSGDVWVAVDGDYVVKYLYSAEDAQATYRWDWEVFDINAPLVIEAPANAQAARDDIPELPDATERASYGGLISYQTASDLDAVIEFYRDQMPAQGWSYDDATSMVTNQFALLNFTKDGQTVNVTLAPDEAGRTSVLIQAEP